jgi:hypothetical protein
MRIRLFLDVIAGVELGEDEEEEVAPLVVVADLGVELELDEASDVDAVHGRRSRKKLYGGVGEVARRRGLAVGVDHPGER